MRFVHMFVKLTEEERIILDSKYKNEKDLKQFLEKHLDKAVLLECESIQLENSFSGYSEEEKGIIA